MARAIGKAFRITPKEVKGYGYAEPRKGGRSMARNPAVTAIAAINGRGSYDRARGRSTRAATKGLSKNQRRARARDVMTPADRAVFAQRLRSAKTKGDKMRSNATQKQIAAARRNIRKAIAARRGGAAHRPNRKAPARRKSARRSTMRSNGQTAAQRRASLANLRKARSAAKRKGLRKNARRSTTKRRTHRRNAWWGEPRRHAKAAKAGWGKRRKSRKMRRNGAAASRRRFVGNAKAFRKNQYLATLKAAVANGALITAGFAAHKGLSKILSRMVFDKLFGAPPTATTPAAAPAVSGLEMLQPYRAVIAGAITAAVGIGATNMVIRDTRTKMFVTGGMAASFLHTLLVTVLDRVSPQAAAALSGAEDSEAARLSAMYGLGAGTSILPHYRPIGEYFTEGVSGMGEYFTEHMSGLGAYGANPDLYQASAGYGAVNNENSNHIDPSSDLDRELSIAEAAAGVGQAFQAAAGYGTVEPFEASAGIGEYFAEGDMQGLGNIARVPTADTWIPGSADGQLWAGVKQIAAPQSANALTRAGILTSGGNQGVFG